MKRERAAVWWRLGIGSLLWLVFSVARDEDFGVSDLPMFFGFVAVVGGVGVVLLKLRDINEKPPPKTNSGVQPSPYAVKVDQSGALSRSPASKPQPSTPTATAPPPRAVAGSPTYDQLFQSRFFVFMAKWMGLAFASACVIMLPAVEPNWPFLLAAVAFAALALRYREAGVWVGPSGVRLVRIFRTESFGWHQVSRFSVGFTGAAKIHLENGTSRGVFAVQGTTDEAAAQGVDGAAIVDELNRLAAIYKASMPSAH